MKKAIKTSVIVIFVVAVFVVLFSSLYTVGYNNYGHPHYEVLRRLKSCHVEIHRTDEEGNITVKAGGDRNG